MRAGHKVLVDVDGNILLIVGDLEGILDQQPRPHPIHLLNIIICVLINHFKLYIIKLFINTPRSKLSEGENRHGQPDQETKAKIVSVPLMGVFNKKATPNCSFCKLACSIVVTILFGCSKCSSLLNSPVL